MATDLRNYAIAFLLTIVLEVAVALLLGYCKRREIACVILVNVFSHPLLCYLIWIADALRSVPVRPVEILLMEGSVVIVEWLLLCYALPQRRKAGLFALSLAMNTASYVAGLVWTLHFV
jgi:hypothetical protein